MLERWVGKREPLPVSVTHEAQHTELANRQKRLERDLESITDARIDALRAEARVLGRQRPRA